MSTLEFQSSTADASVSASTAPVDATITTASLTISTTSSSSSDAAITVDNCVIVNDTTKPLSLSLLTHLSPSSNESHKLLPFVSSASLSTPESSDDTEDGKDMNESVSSHIDLNPTDCSTPNSVDDNSAKKRSRDVEYGADHPYFFTSITNEDKQKQLRKKGPWTQSEDDLLRSLVAKYGPRKWSVIALYVEGRIGKQCRERWMNHLDESLLKTSWTEEEDNLLLKIQKTIGNRWSEMTKYFVGRSENSIKNRWYSVSKPPSRTTLSKTPKEAVSPKLPLLQCEEVKQLSVNEMIDTKSMEELVELARRQPKRQRKSASDIPIDFNLLSSSTAAAVVSSSSPSPQIHKSMLPLRQVSSEPQLLFEQQQQQLNHKLMIDAQMQKMHYQAMQHALSHSPSHTNVQSFNSRSNLPIHMTNAQPMSELCFDPNTYARFSSAKQMHPYQPFNGFIQNNLIQAPQSFPNQFVYPADMNLQGFGLSKVVSPYAHPQAANMHPVNNVMYNM